MDEVITECISTYYSMQTTMTAAVTVIHTIRMCMIAKWFMLLEACAHKQSIVTLAGRLVTVRSGCEGALPG